MLSSFHTLAFHGASDIMDILFRAAGGTSDDNETNGNSRKYKEKSRKEYPYGRALC